MDHPLLRIQLDKIHVPSDISSVHNTFDDSTYRLNSLSTKYIDAPSGEYRPFYSHSQSVNHENVHLDLNSFVDVTDSVSNINDSVDVDYSFALRKLDRIIGDDVSEPISIIDSTLMKPTTYYQPNNIHRHGKENINIHKAKSKLHVPKIEYSTLIQEDETILEVPLQFKIN
jgi:hypothetical protein